MPDFAEQLVMSEPSSPEQVAPAPEVQQAPAASEPASDGRARNPDGTFAPKAKDEGSEQGVKQDAAPPQQAAQPQPEPPSGDEGKHVPLAALNALKAKLAEREAELAKFTQPKPAEQQQQTAPQTPNPSPTSPKGPDFSFDPSDFEDNPQGLFEARIHKNKMDMSTTMAVQQYGEDVVNEAWDAFDQSARTDPRTEALSFSFRDKPHPIGEVVKWYRQHREITQLTEAGGLEKLREQMRAQLMAEIQGQPPAVATATSSAPAAVAMPRPAAPATPPSLAKGGAGLSGAQERPSDNEVFENIFDKTKRLSRSKR